MARRRGRSRVRLSAAFRHYSAISAADLPDTEFPYRHALTLSVDPAKHAANLARRGASRALGAELFEGHAPLVIPSIREIDGEERFQAVGRVGEKLIAAVFVWRDDAPRFISVRRSNKGEERACHSG